MKRIYLSSLDMETGAKIENAGFIDCPEDLVKEETKRLEALGVYIVEKIEDVPSPSSGDIRQQAFAMAAIDVNGGADYQSDATLALLEILQEQVQALAEKSAVSTDKFAKLCEYFKSIRDKYPI